MKKLLITGAGGFIGGFLVEEALEQGYEVFAGIRKSSSKKYLNDKRIKFIELDYENIDKLKTQIADFKNNDADLHYVIHNAGVTKSIDKNDFEKVNYQYTRNLIEALISANIKLDKFIFISSLAVFGPGNASTCTPIQNTDSKRPISLYGKSKLNAEKFIESMNDFPHIIFRPTGVYGAREKDYFVMYKMLNNGLETYIGTQNQYITFAYINDVKRLVISALSSNINKGSYFVTDGNYYSSKEFSDIVKAELNKKTLKIVLPKFIVKPIAYISESISKLTGKISTLNTEKYKEISQKNWLCDSTQTFIDFDFQPQYNLQRGVKETIEWCKKEKLLK